MRGKRGDAGWPGNTYIGLTRGAEGYNPLDVLAQEHRRLHALCDALEGVADGLPRQFDCSLCDMAAKALKYDLPLHHMVEDDGLFPILRKRVRPEDNFESVLAQLSVEHSTDDDYSKDLIQVLEAMSSGAPPDNPEMVGYMLRSFFESYRRHMSIEDGLVFPLARARLTREDLDDLMQVILDIRL